MDDVSAYICGVLCMRGSVAWDNENNNYFINLESRKKDLVENFTMKIEQLFSKRPKIYQKYVKGDAVFIARLYGKEFVENLLILSNGVFGTKTWKVPFGLEKDLSNRVHFLRGVFDAGGYLRIRTNARNWEQKWRNIRITSANFDGLGQIRALLNLEGINSCIYKMGNVHCLDIGGKKNLSKFMEKIGLEDVKKTEKLKTCLN